MVAYVALVIALGTGGAYAVDKVTSEDIRNGAIKSADLRDGKAVRGRDVVGEALTGAQIDEASLDASQFTQLAGFNDAGSCDPSSEVVTACLGTSIDLARPARLLVIATGNQYSALGDPDGSEALCQVQVDGSERSFSASPGETGSSTHRIESSNGFARTLITPEPIPAGTHEVSLACSEFRPDVRIGAPTIAVLAISAG